MLNCLTLESVELLVEEIVDAVELGVNRDEQFELVKAVLLEQGVIEIVE